MTTYVYRNGKLIEKDKAPPRPWATMVISDNMEPLRHMGTGRVIDSKSRFRADTKASGCMEIGTESIKPRAVIPLDRRKRREDIQRAVYDLRRQSR